MSKLGPCVVIAAISCAWGAACTRANPDLCCSSEADCEAQGLPSDQMCTGGLVCRGNQCIAETCTTGGDCDAAAPYCNATGLCEPTCDANTACPGFDGGAADNICGSGGLCVACETSSDCTDAGLPACVANTCVQCATSADCTDAGLPACVANTCVQCATSSDCGSDTPVCDANACRACGSDAECASGVCESTGACADADAVIYVDTTGSDGGTCTQAAPCAHLSYAVTQLQAARNIISIAPGDYVDTKIAIPDGSATSVQILGHGAALTEGETPSIHPLETQPPYTFFFATALPTNVQDLSLETSLSDWAFGLVATTGTNTIADITVAHSNGGLYLAAITTASEITAYDNAGDCVRSSDILTLDRASIHGCDGGIIATGPIDITNTMIFDTTTLPALSTTTSGTVTFSTLVNGTISDPSQPPVIYVAETGLLQVSDSIVWASASGSAVSSSVQFTESLSNDPNDLVGVTDLNPQFVDPSTGNYRLLSTSPAIDVATTGPAYDFEGDSRPQGSGYDLGADEYNP